MNTLKKISQLALICLLFFICRGCCQTSAPKMEVYDIDLVPASFPVGFGLYTYGDHQFVTYYDTAHLMTIASRKIDSGKPANNTRYILRWETLPPNRDLKRTDDVLSETSMLRLYGLSENK